jgi:hypothetical protein
MRLLTARLLYAIAACLAIPALVIAFAAEKLSDFSEEIRR